MPLLKKASKKALEHNIKTEMEAHPGKEHRAQDLAIAFNTQRMAKKKKMALGGAVEPPSRSGHPYSRDPGTPEKKPDDYREPEGEYMGEKWSYGSAPARKPDDMRLPKEEYMAGHFAEGGMAGEDCSNCGHPFNRNPGTPEKKPDNMRPSEDEYMANHFAEGGSVTDSIMSKRKTYAPEGGVNINENAQENGWSPYEEYSTQAYKKELYDDDQLSAQPMDSNESGDDREDERSDKFDMVDKIRKKYKK